MGKFDYVSLQSSASPSSSSSAPFLPPPLASSWDIKNCKYAAAPFSDAHVVNMSIGEWCMLFKMITEIITVATRDIVREVVRSSGATSLPRRNPMLGQYPPTHTFMTMEIRKAIVGV